jgi:hypothetical protein
MTLEPSGTIGKRPVSFGMTRKYFHSSIQELEASLNEHEGDVQVLRALQEELKHRTTERAARLRNRVMERLTASTSATSLPEPQNSFKFSLFPSSLHQPPAPSHSEQASIRSQRPVAKPATTIETLRVAIRNEPPRPLPPITNQPDKILSAWTALEVLSPQAFRRPEDLAGGDRTRVTALNGSALPWERGERSRPNQRLYYQVVLGSINMEPALELLIERYGETRPEKQNVRGNAALAIVVVNRQGQLVASPAVGVSSFGWGVISALKGELADLAEWPNVELQLVKQIEKHLIGGTPGDEEEARKRPLTRTALFSAYEDLIDALGLPIEWIEPPDFAIRSYTYFKDPNAPETLLLNSFFLADLSHARKLFSEGNAPQNLRRYLGVERPQHTQDLLCNTTALAEAVSPALTQLARWPGRNRHPLVLLQQAAVNLAFRETMTGGLIGINGPPGTGKTTLLRDLVAGVVSQRAEAMAKFDNPETAFEHTGQKLKAGNSWIHLYRLDASLRGFEMVVASSNNKAVENVSAELPSLDAIANDAPLLRYFKTLSDALHQCETWGAIAAVLGNAQNRSRFKQTFWWDDDNGLNAYLRVAAGATPEAEVTEPASGHVERRIPHIVAAEGPPSSRQEALERWNIARARFVSALDKSRQWLTWLESLRAELARLPELAKTEASAETNHRTAVEKVRRLKDLMEPTYQEKADPSDQSLDAEQQLRVHDLAMPGFWARLFRTRGARKWTEVRRALLEQQKTEVAWQAARAAHEQAKRRLAEATQKQGVTLVDTTFFEVQHRERHQMTPWLPPAAQHARDEVFISAMALHRAFIDVAAKPLRHNLGALMNVFTTQTLPSPEKQSLLSDLWGLLFLVVPLVSTTFASVNRMLGKLPLESIGWLFVDEAGQALPQAVVGALLRTRRAVIVGDPIQIEPIVVLPDTLTNALCRQFGVDPDYYAAPLASVQTLADAASSYASEFQTNIGSRTVGVPLLVHRRCSEPMFSVSNTIAYSGLMVSAKSPNASEIRAVLGPSRWIDVVGSGEDKWCREEGAEVLHLLRQLAQAGATSDLYVITPFVIVADRLRQLVRESGVLRGWVEDDWRWTHERIGTVHTAQGREAEAVIIVLGAPDAAQTGARAWAGARPNLLNVAVTRAKEVIYVVGNRQLWREAGLFRELDKCFSRTPGQRG